MTITVKLFALGRELAGASEAELELAEGATVAVALGELTARFPELARLPAYLIAVNMVYAQVEAELADGDELAIIPPVSGG